MVSTPTAADSRLVLSANQGERSMARGFNLHMLSPVLIGLATPLLLIGILDPAGLRHGRLIILTLLVSLLAVSTVMFALSLLWAGDTTAIIIDGKARKVEFVQGGLLADTSVEVDFDQIAAIGVASRFDRDGYPFVQSEIRLRDGRRVALPAGTPGESVAAARTVLGL